MLIDRYKGGCAEKAGPLEQTPLQAARGSHTGRAPEAIEALLGADYTA